MTFVTRKVVFYSSLLKHCRLESRLSYSSHSIQSLVDYLSEMPRKKNTSFFIKGDESLSFVGIEILGNSSRKSPCCVSLNTSNRKYLFNCGEGTQRTMSEYRIKSSRYQNIFLTYPSWKNLGGLIGVVLSMQESNVQRVTLHGHPCLEKLFNLMRGYVNLKGIRQQFMTCDHNAEFSDEFLNVKTVHLYKSTSTNPNKRSKESTFFKEKEAESLNIEKRKSINEISADDQENEHVKIKERIKLDLNSRFKSNYAISYIIHTEKSKGALSFEKCLDLGVPVGPLLGKLKKGEDVTLENGKVIKSCQVKDPDKPGVIIMVVECPSEEYLDSLLNEPAFFKHQVENVDHSGCAVIHFSSAKVIGNAKYQEWMGRFSADTKQIFVNESFELGAFVNLHRHQFKLNMVHPEIFPLLHNFGIPKFPRTENSVVDEGHAIEDVPPFLNDKNSSIHIHSDKVYYSCKDNKNINGETLCEILLKPQRKYDYTKCLTLKMDEFEKELREVPDFDEGFQKYKAKIREIENSLPSDRIIYPKLVFLGTGSKKPSKTRSSSCILVFLNEDTSIILDCGEGSYSQLLLFYGEEKVKQVLRTLSAVFVSHMHIDHHLGLTTLLMERKFAFDEADGSKEFKPLTVFAPVQLMPFLHYVANGVFDISDLYHLVPNVELSNTSDENNKKIFNDLNVESVQTVSVTHTPYSYGVSIKHLDGWKLTYSGDTRPSKNLIEIGKDSDILIHEATFDDIYEDEALKKLHCTTGQAISVGREMNAKFILLTHFSQRYCHLPMIKNQLLSKRDVGVAFDFMQVSPYQLPILPYLYEPIKLIFWSYQEQLDQDEYMLKIKRKREAESNFISDLKENPNKISKTDSV